MCSIAPPLPSLSALPPELLFHILPHLPAASKLSLSLTNKRLHYFLSDQVPRWPQIPPEDRYAFLHLLEQMRFVNPTNPNIPIACCSSCKSIHSKYNFTPRELANGPDTRLCRQSVKSLWINPDTQYSFLDLAPLHTAPPGWTSDDRLLRRRNVLDFTICTTHKILSLPKSTNASRKKIARILHTFNLLSCPHTRLDNPLIIDSYNPAAHPLDITGTALCDPHNASANCAFPGCKTHFYWTVRTHAHRPHWKTIYLEINRDIANLKNPDAPAWLAQLITPNTDSLTKFWNDRVAWKRQMLAREERKYVALEQSQQPQHDPLQTPPAITYLKSLRIPPPRSEPPSRASSPSDTDPDTDEPLPAPQPVDNEAELFTPIWGAGVVAANDQFKRKFRQINRGKHWKTTWCQYVTSARSAIAYRKFYYSHS
ncbi:hypothetical protein PRK78_007515 [Emydomyces testavorans]|uniref:F-box domain-containing protein n=1 Tax=Emydomyces testavorans TaxID=2070801 RepID=A0AAF0DS51_9EURO|nr:hypothetical protein PRK78_007515 [Emydomyces testavorans]